MYEENHPSNVNQSFFRESKKPTKKKKYVSLKVLVASLIITSVVSIFGGALLSGVSSIYFNAMLNPGVSVQDNINNSQSNPSGSAAGYTTASGDPLSTPEIVDKVGPAVVGIINKTTYGNAYGQFGSIYGDLNREVEQGSGSGVILSSDGYIVTNNHVIENATAISVILNNGKEYSAKLIGKDAATDLAVIKIDAQNLTYAQVGNSSSLRVGETAIAIGNPLGQEFAGTTTKGIISGLNRTVTIDDRTLNLIQTDAAINPGNSGGALVNEYGYLIGINTAKISSTTLEGLGFAIPIDEAKPIIQDLMTSGYVKGRPVIGIGGRAVTKEDAKAYNLKVGVYVVSMTPNGPAYISGVKVGDIIVECEGEPIETVDDINVIKNKKSPGDMLKIKVYRNGKYASVNIVLGEETPMQ
ncbi:MAG: trypsin-like peptidase domain-containing protein [Clostridia bacterium]|nr:trypsin-like peptidase domain-containing protein [Clostridia bacterium]